jgi:hypothetical protein
MSLFILWLLAAAIPTVAGTLVCCDSDCLTTPTDITNNGGLLVISGTVTLDANSISTSCKSVIVEIYIQSGVSMIGQATFKAAVALEIVNASEANILIIGDEAFDSCELLHTVIIPSAVTIGVQSFAFCSSLVTIDFPNVIDIGILSFIECILLERITFPSALMIRLAAFRECNTLTSVLIPAVAQIWGYAFFQTPALTTLMINTTTATIETDAFLNSHLISNECYNASVISETKYNIVNCQDVVTTTTITTETTSTSMTSTTTRVGTNICCDSGCPNTPESVSNANPNGSLLVLDTDTLGEHSISTSCKAVLEIVYVETGEPDVGPNTFRDATQLRYFEGTLSSVTVIGAYAFEGCTALVNFSCPAVLNINAHAFEGCSALTSLSFPVATEIQFNAFEGCTQLESLLIPAMITIGEFAFYNCNALVNVSIPSITTIAAHAFVPTTSLTGLFIGTSDATINANAFETSFLISESCYNAPIMSNTAYDIVNCTNATVLTTTSTDTITTSTSTVVVNTTLATTTEVGPAPTVGTSQTDRIVMGVFISVGVGLLLVVWYRTLYHTAPKTIIVPTNARVVNTIDWE